MAEESNSKWRKRILSILSQQELDCLLRLLPPYLAYLRQNATEAWAMADIKTWRMLAWRFEKRGIENWASMPPDWIAHYFHWVMFQFVDESFEQCKLRVENHLDVLKRVFLDIEKVESNTLALSRIRQQCAAPSGIVINKAVGEVVVSMHSLYRFCQRAKGFSAATGPMGVIELFQKSFVEAEQKAPPAKLFLSGGTVKQKRNIYLESEEQGIWFVVDRTHKYLNGCLQRTLITVLSSCRIAKLKKKFAAEEGKTE